MVRRFMIIPLALTSFYAHGMLKAFTGLYRTPLVRYYNQEQYRLQKTPTIQALEGASHSLFGKKSWLTRLNLKIGTDFGMPIPPIMNTLQRNLKSFLSSFSWISPHINDVSVSMIINIIQAEAEHPDYESFSHGANGKIAILLELQKKLYAIYCNGGVMPTDFEFLRARKGREHLIGIRREEFTKQRINDLDEPYKTELLSVGYTAWDSWPLHFYSKNESGVLNIDQWIQNILAAYNLPMPSGISRPARLSHGLLLHILIRKSVADRLVYDSLDFGVPRWSIALPNKGSCWTRLGDEARIILDPSVFDHPSDDVKIYRYHPLSKDEKEAVDTFCDKLIAEAQKLKDLKSRTAASVEKLPANARKLIHESSRVLRS